MSCLTDPAVVDPSDRKGITIMTNQDGRVGGVDSHKDTIHIAVITGVGQPVDDGEFATTVAGYRRAVAWVIEHLPMHAVGIEGTSSYGVGITTVARPSAASKARPTALTPTAQPGPCCPEKRAPTPSGHRSNRCEH